MAKLGGITDANFTEIERACYDLGNVFESLAQAECKQDYVNLDKIHWLVSERRRVTNIPRLIKMRYGQ